MYMLLISVILYFIYLMYLFCLFHKCKGYIKIIIVGSWAQWPGSARPTCPTLHQSTRRTDPGPMAQGPMVISIISFWQA